jgi:raffinose/stachyose/melibiose transport system permease protein
MTPRLVAGRTSRHQTGPSSWLLVPALAFFVFFALVPLAGAAVLSFTSWDGLKNVAFVGLESWRQIFADPKTGHAIWLSLKIMVISWAVQTPIALMIGVFIAGRQKYRAVLATIFFVPQLLSSAAVAIAFKNVLDPNFGIGSALHIPFLIQDWLGDPKLVLYVVIFVIAWQFVPFHSLLYQAGVRGIPHHLYEAAAIDGAGRVKQFFHITLPQLRNTIITSSTLMITGSLTYFDVVFVLTGGGPGYATRLLPLDMYLTGFQAHQMGAASALSVILVVIGLTLAIILTKYTGFARMKSDQEGA